MGKIRNAAEKAWGGDEARQRRPGAGEDGGGAGAHAGDRRGTPDAGIPGRSRSGSSPVAPLLQPAGPAGSLDAQGAAATVEGTLQEPEITTGPVPMNSPVVIGDSAGATFGASLQEQDLDAQR